MSRVHVFTSAAFNYIPKARLLFSSLRKHHPEWVLHFALADELHPEFNLADEPFDDVIPLADLGIASWRGWAFCHSIVELCTAIKPFALQRLLRRDDCDRVLYFDPDIVTFSRLDDLLNALNDSNIVLTPHLLDAEADIQAVIDNEICSLRHGVYNLGFIGVRPSDEGLRFADWWSKRAYHFCRDDISNGLFTDQRWIDLVPAFFEGVAVMRSRRHNVATWNITARKISGNIETGLSVNDEPLGFYHFTGFDSGAHLGVATRYAIGSPAVFDLVKWYTHETDKLGRDPAARVCWAYGTFANGEKITPAQRTVYRERLDLQAAFPDPFEAGGYLQWWRTHAQREYPDLFDSEKATAELKRLASILTPGFCAGVGPAKNRNLLALCSALRAAPRQTLKRGWEVLRTIGAQAFCDRQDAST